MRRLRRAAHGIPFLLLYVERLAEPAACRNSVLTIFAPCTFSPARVIFGCRGAAQVCRPASDVPYNMAGVNASLTLRDASAGLQPVISTDACALRKERLVSRSTTMMASRAPLTTFQYPPN